MKKILSALLVVAMLAAMFVCWTIPAMAEGEAYDGFWNTHARASEELDGYVGEKNSVAGFEYYEDGLKVTSADWSKSSTTPWTHVSTTKKVDLQQGVYMEVRIDEFDYSAGDKWFNFNIWSEQAIEEGSGDPEFGYGVQTIIRPANNGTIQVKAPEWAYKQFTKTGADSGAAAMVNTQDANGKNIITLEIGFDGTTYSLKVNGAPAPKKIIDWMNDTYAEDSEAYIGFTMQCSNPDAIQSLTVTKFGVDSSAQKPTTDDRDADKKVAKNYTYDIADIMDPYEVPEGMPAVFMNGLVDGSHLKNTPKSTVGSIVRVNGDKSIRVLGNSGLSDCGEWYVKSDVSYDIKDFPVFLCITRDFCECGGDTLEDCYSFEAGALYLCAGEVVKPASKYKVEISASGDAFFVEDEEGNVHNYIMFIYDFTEDLKEGDEGLFEGRINGTRVDFKVDLETLGRNEFDVMMQGFFVSEDEAIAFAEAYIYGDEIGGGDTETTEPTPDTEPEDETDGEDETEDTGDVEEDTTPIETQAPATTETKAPENTTAPEATTAAPEADDDEDDDDDKKEDTKAPAQTQAPAATDKAEGGCFGTIGFGAVAIVVASIAAGFVAFKKKRD